MRSGPALLLALLLFVCAPAGAAAQTPADRALQRTLTKNMRAAGPASGAYVLNTADRATVFSWKADTPRVLASNTKLFTAAAALKAHGPGDTLRTVVLGSGSKSDSGVWSGDLYLRGGGDPTFGSSAFVQRNYRSGATAEALADSVAALGITRVTGRVFGDESRYDSLRGGPYSGFRTSIYVGPLSALSWNRGFANDNGSAYQSYPPAFAAARFDALLEARGVRVRGKPAAGVAPTEASVLAGVDSPPVSDLLRSMLKPSDNFFAEMMLKHIGGSPGTTRGGAAVTRKHAARLGSRVRIADGSGLSRGNVASPRAVGRLLDSLRGRSEFTTFQRGLPVAGKDGTLHDRMRRGPARGRCRAKTGTLSNVSTLSGYCRSRGGDTLVFSFLMNNVSPAGARRLQDRMTQALAGYRG